MSQIAKSHYHPNVRAAFAEGGYKLGGVDGWFKEDKPICMIGLDRRKAYPAAAIEASKQLPGFPVFNVFGVFMPYDNHKLESVTFYEVVFNNQENYSYREKHSSLGFVLKPVPASDYTITAFLRPSRTKPIDFEGTYKRLLDYTYLEYRDKGGLDPDARKHLACCLVGLTGREDNKRAATKVFAYNSTGREEALRYREEVGGVLYTGHDRGEASPNILLCYSSGKATRGRWLSAYIPRCLSVSSTVTRCGAYDKNW